MFIQLGSAISGGWNALDNITSQIGSSIGRYDSSFFPIPQISTPIKSEITQAGNYASQPYPMGPEAPSIWESGNWAAKDWIASPYAPQYATTTMAAEGKILNQSISAFMPDDRSPNLLDNLSTGLEWAATQSRKIRTLADELVGPWLPRETVKGTPTAGSKEGQDVQYLNDLSKMGADVYTAAKAGAGAILDQVKGLFNLGFPQDSSQPAFGMSHEITVSKGLSTGLIIAAVVIVLLIILMRKK